MKIHDKIKALGPGLVAALALLVIVGLIGFALVVTASLNDGNRNALGVGLLTTAGIGFAVSSVNHAIERRRERRDDEKANERRKGFIESARLSVAALVIDHVEQLAMKLMASSELPDSKSKPTGWRGESDKRLVVRGLMWSAELPRQGRTWWRDPRNIAAVDAIFVVATDVAERSLVNVTDEEVNWLYQTVGRSLARIGIAAERLSQSGDPYGAHELDKLADVLRFGNVRCDLPNLRGWGTETHDDIITVGGHFDKMRNFVAYLIDRLRSPDAIFSTPNPSEESDQIIMKRRWAPLFE
ncbi:hypothetical protein [Burkholderia pseudomallei]|nr:hypothetical protein [Burkholderia pseudomallei]